jgi:hypothetical protein
MNAPESIKNSTVINNGEVQITVENFIVNNFINSNDGKDRLHTERKCGIPNENGYKCSAAEAGRLINRIGVGKYNNKCNIHQCKKVDFILLNMLMKLYKFE